MYFKENPTIPAGNSAASVFTAFVAGVAGEAVWDWPITSLSSVTNPILKGTEAAENFKNVK